MAIATTSLVEQYVLGLIDSLRYYIVIGCCATSPFNKVRVFFKSFIPFTLNIDVVLNNCSAKQSIDPSSERDKHRVKHCRVKSTVNMKRAWPEVSKHGIA